MKPRYYLARLLSGSLQFSYDYYSSYQKANNVRMRQVNPSHWFIVVNPILSPGRRINAEQSAIEDAEKLRQASRDCYMRKKKSGWTKRNQYDEYLAAAYKKTCRDVAVLGFEFATEERQHQFHYGLMEHAVDKYMLYDGNRNRANVITSKDNADAMRAIAESFDGSEFRVILDEEI